MSVRKKIIIVKNMMMRKKNKNCCINDTMEKKSIEKKRCHCVKLEIVSWPCGIITTHNPSTDMRCYMGGRGREVGGRGGKSSKQPYIARPPGAAWGLG